MGDIYRGIDVSQWQGDIDWQKVKADVVDFAILRAGYGRGNIDPKFERNADECTRLEIPFGVYWFSYAYTVEMARSEAKHCLEAVKTYKLDYPIAFDFEYDSVDFALNNNVAVSKELASAMARAFLDEIKAAGYYAVLYANPAYLASYFDEKIPGEYDIWLAQWPYKIPSPEPKPFQAGGLWQYTSNGSVNGINGRVDMNYAYRDYPGIIGGSRPMTDYEKEVADARDYVMSKGVSDGERPDDPVTRKEVWVMLHRMSKEDK